MSNRPETGPMQFGEDWPGVFIRGDNSLGFAMSLISFIEAVEKGKQPNSLEINTCKKLVDILRSAAVGREDTREDIQYLEDFVKTLKK